MTTPNPPLTIRAVLGDALDVRRNTNLATSIRRQGSEHLAARRRSSRLRLAAPIAATLGDLLDVELLDAFAAGWRASDTLVAAARRTRGGSESRVLVELASHRLSVELSPHVELLVDDVATGRVEFTVVVSASVPGLTAVVEDGSLAGVAGGHVDVSVVLSCGDVEVGERRRSIHIDHDLRLREPIPLLGDARVVAA